MNTRSLLIGALALGAASAAHATTLGSGTSYVVAVGTRVGTVGGNGNSNGTVTYANGRYSHWNGPQRACKIQLVHWNGGVANPPPEYKGLNNITIRAAIEYPAGTMTQVKWADATSVTIAPGGIAISDKINICIPVKTNYFTRTNVAVLSGEVWPLGRKALTAVGDAYATGTGANVDLSMSGSITGGNGTAGYFPVNILGTVANSQPSILIFGDSIGAASQDTGDADGNLGFVERGLNNKYGGWMNMSAPSDSLRLFAGSGGTIRRQLWGKNFTHAINEMGVNDITGNSPPAAVVRGRMAEMWQIQRNAGLRVYETTKTTQTTSTDSWVTTANQTATAQFVVGGVRDSVNSFLSEQVGLGIRGVFDAAGLITTSENKFVVPSGVAQTADGIHPNTAGHLLMAPAIDGSRLIVD